jgi:SOS response regulatory protein OraA/RecX
MSSNTSTYIYSAKEGRRKMTEQELDKYLAQQAKEEQLWELAQKVPETWVIKNESLVREKIALIQTITYCSGCEINPTDPLATQAFESLLKQVKTKKYFRNSDGATAITEILRDLETLGTVLNVEIFN